METIVTVVHFVVALLMIGLILIQQGKGASMGASFGGGGSNTVFGSSGGASFFAKLTALLAVIFFVSSLGLTLIARNNAQIDSDSSLLPTLEVEEAVQPEVDFDTLVLPDETPALPVDEFELEEFPETIEEGSSAPE